MSTPPFRVGVLSERGMHVPGRSVMPVVTPIAHIGDLYERATRLGLEQVWVTLDGMRTLGLPEELRRGEERAAHPFIADAPKELRIFSGDRQNPHRLTAWLELEPRGRAALSVSLPAYYAHADAAWGLDTEASTLLTAVHAYAAAVRRPYKWSARRTGENLLAETSKPRMQREAVADWPAPALSTDGDIELTWMRALTPVERERRYLHCYDKNGQYLAACSSVELGLGELTELAGSSAEPVAFDKKLPGYWLLPIDGREGWHCTPWVVRAMEQGSAGPITRAYVWRRHGRALEHWYERLREARTALLAERTPATAAAYQAFKLTYAQVIASFAGTFRQHGDAAFRPDWMHTIHAQAAANLSRAMGRMSVAGVEPVAVFKDAVYIVSDESDPERAMAGSIRLGTGLSDFKVEAAAIPLDRVLPAFEGANGVGGPAALFRTVRDLTAEREV